MLALDFEMPQFIYTSVSLVHQSVLRVQSYMLLRWHQK